LAHVIWRAPNPSRGSIVIQDTWSWPVAADDGDPAARAKSITREFIIEGGST
jgi:hypothetical protein